MMGTLQDLSLKATEDYEAKVKDGFHCSNEFGAYQFGWMDGFRAATKDVLEVLSDLLKPEMCSADENGDRCNHCRAERLIERLEET